MTYTQNEKYDTFFLDFTRVYETWNKCKIFLRQGEVFFLGFLPDITRVNFLKLLFYFSSHEKVKIRNFSSFL